jgi:hypothetical protein
MNLDLPYWFKQRQAKSQDLGQGQWKITGPNLPEAVIGVRMLENLKWQAYVRSAVDSPEIAQSDPDLPTARDAVAGAFELYRDRFVN